MIQSQRRMESHEFCPSQIISADSSLERFKSDVSLQQNIVADMHLSSITAVRLGMVHRSCLFSTSVNLFSPSTFDDRQSRDIMGFMNTTLHMAYTYEFDDVGRKTCHLKKKKPSHRLARSASVSDGSYWNATFACDGI